MEYKCKPRWNTAVKALAFISSLLPLCFPILATTSPMRAGWCFFFFIYFYEGEGRDSRKGCNCTILIWGRFHCIQPKLDLNDEMSNKHGSPIARPSLGVGRLLHGLSWTSRSTLAGGWNSLKMSISKLISLYHHISILISLHYHFTFIWLLSL